jgi:FG-GAP repeat protein
MRTAASREQAVSGDQNLPASAPLTSWKAIARFFERDVRTVQRWEKDEGLPVRRHLHRRKSSVYADPDELRAWWGQRNDLRVEPVPTARRWSLRESAARLPNLPRYAVLTAAAVGFLAVGVGGWKFASLRDERRQDGAPRVVTIAGRPPGSWSIAGPVGDFNGDGRDDLVLSMTHVGRVYIVFGGRRPPGGGAIADLADVAVAAANRSSLAASQVGDFNADGIDDLVLSENLHEPESLTANGSSYLLWGRRDWPARLALPGAADVVLDVVWPTNAGIDGCVNGRGADLNGDGLDDLLLGGVDYGTPERRSAGGALIFFGRRTWPPRLDALSGADVTIDGAETGEALGASCATGDFDGDGAADLAVTALEHTLWNLRGGRGRTYLFRARRPWPRRIDARTDFDLRFDGLRPNASSAGLRMADVTGDGHADLIVARTSREGIPFKGEVRLLFGGARRGILTDDVADVVVEGQGEDAQFGHAVATSDLDGDGLLDLMVGEPGSGTLYALYGRREWRRRGTVDDHAGVRLMRGDRGLGAWHLGVWNLDGSETPDVALTSSEGAADSRGDSVVAWIVEPYRRVKLDVRPEHEPNVILVPNWVCVARVFGFSRAPEDSIDPATLRLAGAPPTQVVTGDYNGDGIVDVQAHFDTARMRLDRNTRDVGILGRTRAGVPIAGTDSVVVTPLGADGSAPPARTAGR